MSKAKTWQEKYPREQREKMLSSHTECCQYHPPETRCGAKPPRRGTETVCTLGKKHKGAHYDAVDSIFFTDVAKRKKI